MRKTQLQRSAEPDGPVSVSLLVVVRDRHLIAKQHQKQVGLILKVSPDSHSCGCSLTCPMACHDAVLSSAACGQHK